MATYPAHGEDPWDTDLKLYIDDKLLKTNNLSDLSNAATARTNLSLGNVDNTADVDKPVSDAAQTALDGKSDIGHLHDDSYWNKGTATGVFEWFEGDAEPSWVASGVRPAGLRVVYYVSAEANIPDWGTAGPLPKDRTKITTASSLPAVRGYGGFTAMTADSSSVVCTQPAEQITGDELWLCVATNGTTPTTPSGWSVKFAMISADSSAGLVVYSKSAVTSDAGATVTVSLGTTTAAVATIIAWVGTVTVNQSGSHTDAANTASSQTFASITPTADTLVLGISSIRYNALSGGTSCGPRTGWTEQIDRTSAKAGAPQRGIVIATRDAAGANGVATGAATATTTQVVRTAEYTVAVS